MSEAELGKLERMAPSPCLMDIYMRTITAWFRSGSAIVALQACFLTRCIQRLSLEAQVKSMDLHLNSYHW